MVDNVAVISDQRHSYMGWGAVLAGAVVAAAVSFLLMAFGTAVGLSVVSPWTGRGAEASTIGLLAAGWFLIVCAGSYWTGGYLAGRMRRGWDDISVEEGHHRDGVHGLVVWAIGVIIFVQLGLFTAASIASGMASAPASTKAAAQDYVIDELFRRTPGAPEGNAAWSAAHREEVGRILARSVTAQPVSSADRSYLAQIVAYETGVSREEAEQRADQAIVNVKKAADAARKSGILAGFLTVTGLLIAAASAWLGAVKGGKDQLGSLLPSARATGRVASV